MGSAIEGDVAVFRYAGPDGTITYRWSRPQAVTEGILGAIEAEFATPGGERHRVPIATTASVDWVRKAEPVVSRWAATGESVTLERTFRLGDQSATLTVKGQLRGKSLVLDVSCDRPVVSRFDAGGWGPTVRRRAIAVPYLSGVQVEYLPHEDLFVSAHLHWLASSATQHEITRASYLPLTGGGRSTLSERVDFSAAWHLDEVLPNIPNPPSPFLRDLADRVVLDVWGGRYEDIAARLEGLHALGVDRCVVLVHDWQRSGYDNALPAHLPAASDKGGDPGMKVLVATATKLGYRIALHENYVDYYPNYEGFREADIALDSEGRRQNAWYNPGTKIQSFAVQPNAILPLARTQTPEIHRRFGTNANYLDVHSAVPPWFHVDQRAGEAGAGQFRRVFDVHAKLWKYERETRGGPVFGEGNNHWYWSGLLDGAEAQFGSGWPGGKGESVPLLVDFDLLRIHPLQLNHGMGYYERWWDERTGPKRPLMAALDQYRMQEVAFAHAGFLGAPTWSNQPLAWLEHHLLAPVMARVVNAAPLRIEYEWDGRWLDASEAVRRGADFQCVRVTYDDGLTVVANQSPRPLGVGGRTLPQYGWAASGSGLEAGTTLRDGVVSDFAESSESVFVNARDSADWTFPERSRIRPALAKFESDGRGSIRFTYRWNVAGRLPAGNHTAFVHFDLAHSEGPTESIVFQQDHATAVPTSEWKPATAVDDGPFTFKLPAGIPDGDYIWLIGLIRPGGERIALEGNDDGTRRIRLGTLVVRDGSLNVSFKPDRLETFLSAPAEPDRLNHSSRVLDFGSVRTSGSLLIRRQGGEWVALAMPRDRAYAVRLRTSRFGRPERVTSPGGEQTAVVPKHEGDWWLLPLNGAQEYRWPATGG